MSKSPKQLPNRLKRAKTSVILIVVDGVLCEGSTYTVTVSYLNMNQVPENIYLGKWRYITKIVFNAI
jgi:hypothetical protein